MSACLRSGFYARSPTFEVRVEHVSSFIWDSYLLPWLQASGARIQGDGFQLLTVSGDEQVRCTPLSQRELERRASDTSIGVVLHVPFTTFEAVLQYSGTREPRGHGGPRSGQLLLRYAQFFGGQEPDNLTKPECVVELSEGVSVEVRNELCLKGIAELRNLIINKRAWGQGLSGQSHPSCRQKTYVHVTHAMPCVMTYFRHSGKLHITGGLQHMHRDAPNSDEYIEY
jgi:hypothetical protein